MKLIKGLITLAVIAAIAWTGITVYGGYQMYEEAITECSLAEKAGEVTAQENFTQYKELPKVYVDAVLAVEDRKFYTHHGFNLKSTLRAVYRNITSGELVEGGSTITQQLAKVWYFDMNKKFDRKVAELFMALQIEKLYDKNQILEFYLNSIYFGSGYYNVYDASMGYFGKAPIDMNDYEATMLAGIPNAPSVYSPDVNPTLAEQRRQQVVGCMVQYGYIEEGQIS